MDVSHTRCQSTSLHVPVNRRRVEVVADRSGCSHQPKLELQTPCGSSPPAARQLSFQIASSLGQQEESTPKTRAPLAAPGIQSDDPPCQPASPTTHPHCQDNNPMHGSQDVFEPMLQLDSINAPVQKLQLQPGLDPDLRLVEYWTEHHRNYAICGVQLVADTRQRKACVGVDSDIFSTWSHWAKVRSGTQLHTSEAFVVCPLRVAPGLLHKMIKSFYSLSLELSEDAEQMLRLANCLQVSDVEKLCVAYLLSLDLELQQTQQLAALFNELGYAAAYNSTLQRLFEMPWSNSDIVAVITAACRELLAMGEGGIQLCKELLHSSERGALCELQVLDVLEGAGLSLQESVLRSLFQVPKLSGLCLEIFQSAIHQQPPGAVSTELMQWLLLQLAPSDVKSWSDYIRGPKEDVWEFKPFSPKAPIDPETKRHPPLLWWTDAKDPDIKIQVKCSKGCSVLCQHGQDALSLWRTASSGNRHWVGGHFKSFAMYTLQSSQPHVRIVSECGQMTVFDHNIPLQGLLKSMDEWYTQGNRFAVGMWVKRRQDIVQLDPISSSDESDSESEMNSSFEGDSSVSAYNSEEE